METPRLARRFHLCERGGHSAIKNFVIPNAEHRAVE
jgi:hypothetical protein